MQNGIGALHHSIGKCKTCSTRHYGNSIRVGGEFRTAFDITDNPAVLSGAESGGNFEAIPLLGHGGQYTTDWLKR